MIEEHTPKGVKSLVKYDNKWWVLKAVKEDKVILARGGILALVPLSSVTIVKMPSDAEE